MLAEEENFKEAKDNGSADGKAMRRCRSSWRCR